MRSYDDENLERLRQALLDNIKQGNIIEEHLYKDNPDFQKVLVEPFLQVLTSPFQTQSTAVNSSATEHLADEFRWGGDVAGADDDGVA